MNHPRLRTALLAAGIVAILLVASSPWIVAQYWRARSSNPVRRGVVRARELGCFACHGELGGGGIPIPGSEQGVPSWSGGVWMMYVKSDDEIRRYIVDGSPRANDEVTADPAHDRSSRPTGRQSVTMPAYGAIVSEADLTDLVATFKVLSGMAAPARNTPARRGYELARDRQCFACHGPAGAGGASNPGSFAGFVPGWYGPDFDDLVRDREEFATWILEGGIPRLREHPIARYFLRRQSLQMPAYRGLSPEELDGLWAYVRWLRTNDGGHAGDR